jgi:hypothetical protein
VGIASAAFPQAWDKFVAWCGLKTFGPFVVLVANDEGNLDEPLRGQIELKIYDGALWGDRHYSDGVIRNYSGFLKNGFIVLSYRSTENGYGEYFLAANSPNQTEYIGHALVNSCPGKGVQVVKDCNIVILSAKGKDIPSVENEGLRKHREFLRQACRDVRFQDMQLVTNKVCPAEKQAPLASLTEDQRRQRGTR